WRVAREEPGEVYWSLPVVGETWDGTLSDIGGMHVRPEHVWAALEAAAPGHVEGVRRHLFDVLTPEQVEQLGRISAAIRDGLLLTGDDGPHTPDGLPSGSAPEEVATPTH
ncbi:MAG TPA: P1 family peptidase, partial [Acidimicrobiales bacterium]|nr:P1 family peptidase [Acidimicrobiales bacterium]